MTPAEILHKYGNDSAFLFRDFQAGELNTETMHEFKKQQAILRDVAERSIRNAIALESKK